MKALEEDFENPLGHFELGVVLEKEKYWADALSEYRTAKLLASKVKSSSYTDRMGNPYEIEVVRKEVDQRIDMVAKRQPSKEHEK